MILYKRVFINISFPTFSINQEFTEDEDFELNMIVEAALDVDDDGNYPLRIKIDNYTKTGNILTMEPWSSQLNVDFIIVKKFDKKFSKIKSENFIKNILY